MNCTDVHCPPAGYVNSSKVWATPDILSVGHDIPEVPTGENKGNCRRRRAVSATNPADNYWFILQGIGGQGHHTSDEDAECRNIGGEFLSTGYRISVRG